MCVPSIDLSFLSKYQIARRYCGLDGYSVTWTLSGAMKVGDVTINKDVEGVLKISWGAFELLREDLQRSRKREMVSIKLQRLNMG